MDEQLKKFDLLLLEYKEGGISDEDLAELQTMLKENETLREHFVRAQALDAMLSIEEEFALPEEIYSKPQVPLKGNFSLLYKIAALLIISFSLAVVFFPGSQDENKIIAELDEAGEGVKFIRDGKTLKAADVNGLQDGDTIITEAVGASISYINEETTVFLKENSEVVFKLNKGAKVILLNKGDIICDVDKQPPGKPMTVLTPHAEATVLGTQFLLSAGKESSKLHVNEGAVNFRDKQTNETFEAKAGWTTRISQVSGNKSFRYTVDKNLIYIKGFTLLNADTSQPFPQFDPIPDGAVISLSELGTANLNILANVELKPRYVGAVRFIMDSRTASGKKIKIFDPRGRQRNNCVEGIFPFMFGGDTDDEPVKCRIWKAVPGIYKLSAVPFGEKEKKGASGNPSYLNFTIVE